jgi:hypothetical protein
MKTICLEARRFNVWFKSLLAALGIAYDVLRCIACGVLFLSRKGDIRPPGWVVDDAGLLCPSCAKPAPTEKDLEDPSQLPDGPFGRW